MLCVVVAAAAAGCAAPAGSPPAALPIAAARELATGSRVTVEGVVTVRAGTFDAGFALQDATGGIYVTRADGIAPEIGERSLRSESPIHPRRWKPPPEQSGPRPKAG
jgi:hypothetical protein